MLKIQWINGDEETIPGSGVIIALPLPLLMALSFFLWLTLGRAFKGGVGT